MSKITDIPKKIKSAFTKQADVWLLLELAAVILIITVAANYIINYVTGSLSSKNNVNSWEYIYTNSAAAPSYASGNEWNTANTLNPMSKEKTGSYLHLRGNIVGNGREQTLTVETDFAPVKISVNGTEVYNNHFGQSEYTGNCYNAIVIPASNGGTTVEISMRLPFSAHFQSYIADGGESAAYTVGAGLVFSLIVLILGIVSLAVSAIGFIIKKKKRLSIAASLLITAYGAAAALPSVSHGSYLVNFPRFYNISVASEIFLVILLAAAVAYVLKIKDKGIIVFLCLGAVSAAAVLIPQNVLMFNAVSAAASVISCLAAVALAVKCKGLLNRRIQYAKGAFAMLSFLAMLDVLCGAVQLMLKYRVNFAYCRPAGEFVFLCFIVFILSSRLFANRNPDIVEYKTAAYNEFVTKVADLMKQVLRLNTEEEICKTVADGVYGLCSEMSGETGEADGRELAFSVSVKENSGYREIYNKSLEGKVNCAAIEHRCEDGGNCCLFAESYFDLVFEDNNDYHIFFHFENIKDGLSSFFTGIVATLYSCIEVAIAHFSLNGADIENREIDIFTKLADDTEISSGNNPDHLECVAYYTKAMLEKLGYSDYICETVSKAAMLHDIGKIAIPFEITNKAGLLSESEREIIKKHTEYGYILLSVFDDEFMEYAAVIAKEHHERYDGKGYCGIAGDSINEYARVVMVADTLDALTTKRSYKEAWPIDTVIEYIDSNSGTMYDPKVVAAMHECIGVIKKRVTEKE